MLEPSAARALADSLRSAARVAEANRDMLPSGATEKGEPMKQRIRDRFREWLHRELTELLVGIRGDLAAYDSASSHRAEAMFRRLDDLKGQWGTVPEQLSSLQRSVEKQGVDMATVMQKLADLQLKIANESTVIESAKTAFAGFVALVAQLRQDIADLGATEPVLAKVDELSSAVDAQTNDLAAAIPPNTAAANEPPPAPPAAGDGGAPAAS
ncbi:MAG TPA: hypothetical protein VNH45_11205 [Gaiellaceae bacterium]|nr:hypothetical protein [Gaiellaceae bacterium]